MNEFMPFGYSLYAVPQTLSGTEVLLFGAAIGILALVLMLFSAGWKAHKDGKLNQKRAKAHVKSIHDARIACVVEVAQALSVLDRRKINLRRDRAALDAITIECAVERGNLDTMPIFSKLVRAEDIFVESFYWTESMAESIVRQIGEFDQLIASGEKLEASLLAWSEADANSGKPTTAQSFNREAEVLTITLQKEIKLLRDLKALAQKDCDKTATFLITMSQPVHLEGDGDGARAQWIKARHSGVMSRLFAKTG